MRVFRLARSDEQIFSQEIVAAIDPLRGQIRHDMLVSIILLEILENVFRFWFGHVLAHFGYARKKSIQNQGFRIFPNLPGIDYNGQ